MKSLFTIFFISVISYAPLKSSSSNLERIIEAEAPMIEDCNAEATSVALRVQAMGGDFWTAYFAVYADCLERQLQP